MRHIGHLIDEARKLGQSRQVTDQHLATFQLQQRDDGGEVAIADALAIAVHRSLHLHGTGFDRGQSIGHAETAVVVRVGTDRTRHRCRGCFGRFRDKRRKTSAVGIAKHNEICTRFRSGFDRGQRILAVFAVAVEEVLRIVEDLPPVRLEEGNRVADHGKVFFQSYAKDFRDMQRPCFPHDRDHRRLGVEQLAHLRIVLHLHAAAPRHAESCDLRVLPRTLGRLGKELDVLRIRTGPSALDVIDPELVEALGHAQLVLHTERNAGALRAITQGGIVNSDCRRLLHSPISGQPARWLKPRFPSR